MGATGEPFAYVMGIAASGGPPLRASIIVACTGYDDSTALAFEVQPGRFRCEAANVGTVTVVRSKALRE